MLIFHCFIGNFSQFTFVLTNSYLFIAILSWCAYWMYGIMQYLVFCIYLMFTLLPFSSTQNYGSLDSMEPAKDIVEKDKNVLDSTLVAEIDKTMKKHSENLLHVLEGVSARLTQLESRTRHLENSVDELKMSVGNNQGNTDGVMRQLENILREV